MNRAEEEDQRKGRELKMRGEEETEGKKTRREEEGRGERRTSRVTRPKAKALGDYETPLSSVAFEKDVDFSPSP